MNQMNAFYILVMIIGLLTNLGYVVTQTGSQKIAKHFDQEDLMPGFQIFLTGVAFIVRITNSKFLIRISYRVRNALISICTVLAYLILGFTYQFSPDHHVHQYFYLFIICLIASCVMGFAQGAGEVIFVGFLKQLPPEITGAFSSGTGFAGIFGTGVILALVGIGLTYPQIFFICSPTGLFYFFMF